MPRILIVDDDRDTCRVIAEVLVAPGREFEFASESERAVQLARTERFDLVISDINLNSSMNGLDVLRAFKDANPDGQVLLISGFGTLQTAIEAVRAGAFDYISKSFDIEEVKKTVQRALDQGGTVAAAHVPGVDLPPGEELMGRTPAMLAVYKQIARAADSVVPVLIVGGSSREVETNLRLGFASKPQGGKVAGAGEANGLDSEPKLLFLRSREIGRCESGFDDNRGGMAGEILIADGTIAEGSTVHCRTRPKRRRR